MMAPQNAGANPRTLNPGTSKDANFSIRALITIQKIPNVSTMRGKVRIFKRKPNVPFTKPMMTAARRAAPNPLTEIPGTNRATSRMQSALRTQCAMSLAI